MAIVKFNGVETLKNQLGGKAWGLGHMAALGFPVPDGIILTAIPTESEWLEVQAWWSKHQFEQVAVRSSAAAEDSSEHSFAGQNLSFLNVSDISSLKKAVFDCFESVKRQASRSYRKFFLEPQAEAGGMNVVIQLMVKPKFSGVFFSQDPRTPDHPNWILEVVPGLGEKLVSGHVTPGRVDQSGKSESLPPGFEIEHAYAIAKIGLELEKKLNFAVDVEWAMDQKNQIKILQSRPITTLKKEAHSSQTARELKRLEQNYPSSTIWDAHTFSDWTGQPCPSTLSLWKKVFLPKHAFGEALKTLGYESFSNKASPSQSLLETIFGRGYLNLTLLSDLYYGPIPYQIVTDPKPRTRFDFKKITPRVLLHTPIAIWEMLHVAWNVTTHRRVWIQKATQALVAMRPEFTVSLKPTTYQSLNEQELKKLLQTQTEFFSKSVLHWPLLITVLIESTMQRLELLLKSIFGEEKSRLLIQDYMSHGLHTVTMKMNQEFQTALLNPSERATFLKRYGHRGPGEMDLSKPRWAELKDTLWAHSTDSSSQSANQPESPADIIETQIKTYNSYKREIILEEWRLLKSMLELREQWKMELLKTVGLIRILLNSLGQKNQLGSDVHYLEIDELLSDLPVSELRSRVLERKVQTLEFAQYDLPDVFCQKDILTLLKSKWDKNAKHIQGVSLAPGVALGRVKIVKDATTVDPSTWTEPTILVAQTTDPGWTPLFAQSKAMIVERGGVLSHCAILAREMGIPAVSEIRHASQLFKDGDLIRVDGNTGRIDVQSS